MPRAQSWYRTQQFGEYLLTGPAAVLNLGSFTEGQTLARMHVDLSCVGDWYNGEGAVFEGPYEFVQTVIAFAFQQDPEGGVAPGGFFGGWDGAGWLCGAGAAQQGEQQQKRYNFEFHDFRPHSDWWVGWRFERRGCLKELSEIRMVFIAGYDLYKYSLKE